MELRLPKLIRVPAGSFIMGATETDLLAEPGEEPLHVVSISEYFIATVPVTVGMWRRFLLQSSYEWKVSKLHDQWYLADEVDIGERVEVCEAELWELVGAHSPTDDHPMVWVSWYDCIAFTRWLQVTTRANWGLPTEAEWERAARGNDRRLYPWGDELPSYLDESSPTMNYPVARSATRLSALGCRDMWDNVCEWCWDWYGDDYYSVSPTRDPVGPTGGVAKVVRGGRCGFPGWPRCSYRRFHAPHVVAGFLGFRLRCNSPPTDLSYTD